MKKLLSIILTGVLCASMLAGCTKKEAVSINSNADLNQKRIGVQEGTTGETWVTENVDTKPDNIASFKSGMDAAIALKNGSIDLIILDELPAKAIVEKNESLKVLDLKVDEPEEYAIAIKKGNTALVDIVNAAIDKMQSDGTYESLVAAFMPEEGEIVIPAEFTSDGTEVIKMGTNSKFPPFEYAEGSDIVGFDVSMAQLVAKQAGKKLEVVDMDFNSLIGALSAGTIDFVAAGMSVTEDRLKNVDFSKTYYSSQQVIIVKK